ncbi:hypothetical protein DHD32_21050 [Arenibacter sp. TNZ]|uniref:hypothetical protein n=1 Tax=Arenibacter TaxID=178469 RepID=UPI000CD48928|nr:MULTISPECIES: hypothetical protein [Arenibacter]MCM4173962.1 hypothetical protein [Arenibacter sp. TNZ]
MNTNAFLKTILILILLSGCDTLFPTEFCKNELQLLKGNSDDIIKIDLGLVRTDLINSIQSQTALDLCTGPILNTKINIKNQEFEFSLLVLNECGGNTTLPNVIRILLTQDDMIINNHSVTHKKDFDFVLEDVTEKLRGLVPFKEVIYLIDWEIGMDWEQIKSQIVLVLKGITNYSNELSFKKFNAPICELNPHQLEFIDLEFKGILGIADYSNRTLPNAPQVKEMK